MRMSKRLEVRSMISQNSSTVRGQSGTYVHLFTHLPCAIIWYIVGHVVQTPEVGEIRAFLHRERRFRYHGRADEPSL